MKNFEFLFAAYTAVWVGFFLYTFSLNRRQSRLMEEVGSLREQLEKKLKA